MVIKHRVHGKQSVNLSSCSCDELNKQKSSHPPKSLVVKRGCHWGAIKHVLQELVQADLLVSKVSLLEELRLQNYPECKLDEESDAIGQNSCPVLLSSRPSKTVSKLDSGLEHNWLLEIEK